ncbi:hypothetical protein ACFFSY_17350 [Paenibacillus aurantiacus]|uniref:RCK C-terminal domain-containing protein n=1 Tax=Paenibacillus aurantiacus TaxID=1936118 RepID=A0ABV5KR67_9BACL
MSGLVFIFIYFVIMTLVVEISSELLIVTGLKRDISRFQVISMLTGTGFTTKESELILRHPIRRKIGIALILFGAFSLAVVISSITNILADDFRIPQLLIATASLLLVCFIVKHRRFHAKASPLFEKHLQQDFQLHELPIQEVLYVRDNDLFAAVSLHEHSGHIGRQARDVFGEEEDVNLLYIKRGQVHLRTSVRQETLAEGDVLFVYGDKAQIKEKFKEELSEAQRQADDEKRVSTLLE